MWSKVLKWTEREQMPLLNNSQEGKPYFLRAAHLLWKPTLMQGVTLLLHFLNADAGLASFNSSGISSWQTP